MREKGTHDYGASVLEDEEHAALRGYAMRVREDVIEGDAYDLRSLVGWTLLALLACLLEGESREETETGSQVSVVGCGSETGGVTEVLGYVRAALLRRDARCLTRLA